MLAYVGFMLAYVGFMLVYVGIMLAHAGFMLGQVGSCWLKLAPSWPQDAFMLAHVGLKISKIEFTLNSFCNPYGGQGNFSSNKSLSSSLRFMIK